jgi:hypothetical protein
VALNKISKALDAVEEELFVCESFSASLSPSSTPKKSRSSSQRISKKRRRLYVANETITMAKLHDELLESNGCYLSLLDEIEGIKIL